jgi:hypothetical protein
VTLSFIDERQFQIVIQPVLPLHKCADHAPAEFAVESLYSVADSTAAEEAAADPDVVESTVEPLHSATNPAGFGAALTKTFSLCVQVWILSLR